MLHHGMASTTALPEVAAPVAPAPDAPIDMANLPAGVDPVMAQIVANMSPEELAELHADQGAAPPQDSPQDSPQVADPVADLTAQALAPVPDVTPVRPQAPATDPVLVETLRSIQALVQAQAQENANLRQMLTPKRNPTAELEAQLPEEYRGDPKLLKFIQTVTNLVPRGADPNEIQSVKAELAAMKQAAFANDYANRNAQAVSQAVIGQALGGKADVKLPDGSSLADELRELNFAVGAVHKMQPEQAAARSAALVEAIGKAYVAAMAAKTQTVAQNIKAAPKPVPAATPAAQAPQSDLNLTPEAIKNAGGNPVRAVFNMAFGRKR